jgi:DNA-binding NarL/FixJ family response regulator
MTLSRSQVPTPISPFDVDIAGLSGWASGRSAFDSEAYVAVTVLLPVSRMQRSRSAAAGDARRPSTNRSPKGGSMKALLIDDHPLILSALQSVIQGLGPEVGVVGVATARAAREALVADPGFDLVLLDLQLADQDGFELLGELRAAYPALPVVVVSASDRSTDVIRAIDLGAMGFVPKCASNETLFQALNMVMSGGIYVPPMIMRSHVPTRSSAVPSAAHGWGMRLDDTPAGADRQAGPPLAALGLTPRQTDVLALLAQGQPNKLIARALNLSVETVKDHVAAVLRTLNVSSRTQAVLAISQMSHQGALAAWRESRQAEARRG